jgi:hypothetical protein
MFRKLFTDIKSTPAMATPVLWFCFLLIVFAAFSRLIPHPSNFTPIGAVGLFAGAYLNLRRYWLVPLAALLLSDFFIGFYHPVTMASVYLAFFICAMMGRVLLYKHRTILRIAVTTLSASILFFVLSNFGDWLSGFNYPGTWAGLAECYVMAIPFFGNTLSGDLVYVSLLFGIYEAARLWLFQQTMPAA